MRNVRGDFRFRGQNTNPSGGNSSGVYSFADFLLGLPGTTSRQIGAEPADTTGTQYAFFAQDDYRVTNWLTLNLGLRYEYQTALSEKTGRLANLLISPNSVGTLVCPQEVRSSTGAITCVSAASVGLPETLVNADKNNFGPRVGFALRPFKDDKTFVRGGAGIYYSLETFNPIRQQLAVQSPFLNRINYTRVAATPLALSLANPFPGGIAEGTPRGMNPDYKQPEIYQFNLTVERQLARDLVLEVGYVGSQGRFLGLRYNYNAALLAVVPVSFRRLRAQYGTATVQYQDQFGNSSYNALQSSLRRCAANGLTLLLSYTFSKSIDTGSSTNNSTTGSQDFPQDIRDILGTQRGLSDFHRKHHMTYNLENKDSYYYRRVFLGCLRANDFLVSLPQFDGKNLGVIGGSQGGALAIMTAALDSRVKVLAASYPALSDLTGYIYGRAGGWFHRFKDKANRTKEKIETSKYYDTVNFAKRLKTPGIYSFGYNDEVCPPTSVYAAYNQISAPKTLLLGLEMEHGNSPEQGERINNWIEKYLKEGKAE